MAFGNNIVPALIPGQQDQFFTQRNPVGSGPSSLASTATCVCSSALVAMARIEDSPPPRKMVLLRIGINKAQMHLHTLPRNEIQIIALADRIQSLNIINAQRPSLHSKHSKHM